MPSKQYLAKIEARRRTDAENRRRKLYTALRKGDIDPSPMTHTVHFKSQPITVNELEYLWLKVRGHIMENYAGDTLVTDHHHLHLKEPPNGS